MTARPAACQPVEPAGGARHVRAMSDTNKEREQRLAAALRENLKRRKAQARQQSTDGHEAKPEPQA
jgi:hypothetical protein